MNGRLIIGWTTAIMLWAVAVLIMAL